MMRLAYNALFPFAFAALLPKYLLRMFARGGFRADFGQRFARYSPLLRERLKRGDWVWVHAVSVGELLVALKVIRELHRRNPALRFLVSSTTSTAHAIALSSAQDWWSPVYTPVDFLPVVKRALDAAKPRAAILTESEMWPNFVWELKRRGVPVALVNARVSPRSERRYRKFARVLRTVASELSAVGLQEPEHGALWELLGVPQSRQKLTGSVKFDPGVNGASPRDFRPVLEAHGFLKGEPVLLAGSTHAGEEAELSRALRELRPRFPSLRLVVAPRHVERSSEVASLLARDGWRVALRDHAPSAPAPDVLVINTTGELSDWYACGDVVFIGKSLCGTGGQNPVEAILAEKPVIFGPHMENFAALRDALLAAGGAVEIRDGAALADAAGALLADPARRKDVAANAKRALAPHRGATARTADLIESLLAGSDSRPRPM